MVDHRENFAARSHIDDDFCTDLLNRLVSRTDAEKALNHVAECGPCENLFRRHVAAFETIRAGDSPVRSQNGRWILVSNGAETTDSKQRPKSDATRPNIFGWLSRGRLIAGGLATAAVAAALVLLPLRPHVPPPEYRLTGSREVLETRSGTQPVDKRFWKGVEAYEANEFDRAVWLLRQAGLEGPYNDLRMIYIASALTLQQNYPLAVDAFTLFDIETLPEPWRSEAKWIQYIALAGDRRDKEANTLLQELTELDNAIGELARERLKALE